MNKKPGLRKKPIRKAKGTAEKEGTGESNKKAHPKQELIIAGGRVPITPVPKPNKKWGKGSLKHHGGGDEGKKVVIDRRRASQYEKKDHHISQRSGSIEG